MSYQFAANRPNSINAQSSFGLSPNAASLVSYLWIPVTSILVLATEKQNRLVRFHAFQSLFLGLGVFALSIVLSVVGGVLMLVAGVVSPYLGIVVSLASLLVWLVLACAILGLWIMCLVKAYRGEMYKAPLVGKFAERTAGK
jgi:uncharacterized membrane protein